MKQTMIFILTSLLYMVSAVYTTVMGAFIFIIAALSNTTKTKSEILLCLIGILFTIIVTVIYRLLIKGIAVSSKQQRIGTIIVAIVYFIILSIFIFMFQ